jgi:hypothetical protein
MILYVIVGVISYYTSIRCFVSFYKGGSQKTWTRPDNDALMRLVFGGKHVIRINNLKGGILWLISATICTVLFIRELKDLN